MERGVTPGRPRRVMVVAEPTRESAAALQYALSHGVVEQDELILLYIENPASWKNTFSTFFRSHSIGNSNTSSICVGANGISSSSNNNTGSGGGNGGDLDFLEEMKKVCEAARPKVRVGTTKTDLEGCRDKASVILDQCTMHGVDVLIIGQRRSLATAILGAKKSGGSIRGPKFTDTTEYLIENCVLALVWLSKGKDRTQVTFSTPKPTGISGSWRRKSMQYQTDSFFVKS